MRFPDKALTPTRFAEAFGVFVARSLEYPQIITQLVRVTQECSPGYACFDVGAGTGMVVRDWIAAGGRLPGRFVALEPNAEHIRALETELAELGCETRLIDAPFAADFSMDESFDLIYFSHSCYWFTQPIECLLNAYQALKPGGRLVVIHQSPLGFYPFYTLYNPLLERDRPDGQDNALSSHELVAGLRNAGFSPRYVIEPSWMRMNGIFDEASQDELDQFVSFLLQAEFSQMNDQFRADAIQYLKAACVEIDDELVISHPTACIELVKE